MWKQIDFLQITYICAYILLSCEKFLILMLKFMRLKWLLLRLSCEKWKKEKKKKGSWVEKLMKIEVFVQNSSRKWVQNRIIEQVRLDRSLLRSNRNCIAVLKNLYLTYRYGPEDVRLEPSWTQSSLLNNSKHPNMNPRIFDQTEGETKAYKCSLYLWNFLYFMFQVFIT